MSSETIDKSFEGYDEVKILNEFMVKVYRIMAIVTTEDNDYNKEFVKKLIDNVFIDIKRNNKRYNEMYLKIFEDEDDKKRQRMIAIIEAFEGNSPKYRTNSSTTKGLVKHKWEALCTILKAKKSTKWSKTFTYINTDIENKVMFTAVFGTFLRALSVSINSDSYQDMKRKLGNL